MLQSYLQVKLALLYGPHAFCKHLTRNCCHSIFGANLVCVSVVSVEHYHIRIRKLPEFPFWGDSMEKREPIAEIKEKVDAIIIKEFNQNGAILQYNSSGEVKGRYHANPHGNKRHYLQNGWNAGLASPCY